eukprot:GSChrysophyteH1.ASY1.ANO1.1484.1 assembled CDS
MKANSSDIALSDQLLGELYVFLVKQCNVVLNTVFVNTIIDKDNDDINSNGQPISDAYDDQGETIPQLLIRLLNQAKDCEDDGRTIDAEQRHLERLQTVRNDVVSNANTRVRGEAFLEIGKFYLRECARNIQLSAMSANRGDQNSAENQQLLADHNIGRAREALQSTVNDLPNEWSARQLLGCLLHESGQEEEAGVMLQAVVNTQLDKVENAGYIDSYDEDSFAGYESDKLVPVDPMSYTILACHFSLINQPLRTRKALRLAVKSFELGNHSPEIATHGIPRRTYVLLLSRAAVFLAQNGFTTLCSEAYKLGAQCEEAADKVSQSRETVSVTSPHIRFFLKYAYVEVTKLQNSTRSESVSVAAEDAIEASPDINDQINGYICAASAFALEGDIQKASSLLYNAAALASENGCCDMIPQAKYLESAKYLLSSGKTQEALQICYLGMSAYNSASLNLLMGICLLRSDRLVDAELAFREANLLDNRNCEVWAYQALLCLTIGYHRLPEAEAALQQTLRLGLGASPVLRELGTAFIAVDKLQTAEDLIRRALAAEGGKGSPYTRKLLGDVLAGQQQAAKAVDEYKLILDDDFSDNVLKIQAAEKSYALLTTLGRTEEAATVNDILKQLQ